MTRHRLYTYDMGMIVGNDISSFQGDPNFDIVVKNANFVITKVTEGVGYANPNFKRTQSEARRVGLLLGYYHFAKPSLGFTAEAEADYFLSVIGILHEGEILVLDYEDDWAGDVVAWCKDFLDHIYLHTKVQALIYLNKSQVRNFNWDPVAKAGYGLWLAAYDNNLITGAWNFVALQQWTNAEDVPGYAGKVDGDYFFGTAEQFKAYGYKKVVSPSSSISASVSPSSSVSSTPSPSPSLSSSVSPSASQSVSISPSGSASPSSEVPTPLPTPHLQFIQWLINLLRRIFNG